MFNFYHFYNLLNETGIQIHNIGNESVLVYQYSPHIQIHSGLGDIDKEYFKRIFSNHKPPLSEIKQFVHSYVKNDPSGERMGCRMKVYDDGKIVLGKAMNHVYLTYSPDDKGKHYMEGYFNPNNQKLIFSESSNKSSFDSINVWKNILNNFLKAKLIEKHWKIIGCPPSCQEDNNTDNNTVAELLNKKNKLQISDNDSLKKKETQAMVSSFMTQRAIQNKNSNLGLYLYRYGEQNNK